jgi:hypothetical protein
VVSSHRIGTIEAVGIVPRSALLHVVAPVGFDRGRSARVEAVLPSRFVFVAVFLFVG